jgi:3-oxoacyl-[acyl-carrier-protein] synthase-3
MLTNADLEKMVATSDEWIVQRSGIRERHIADETRPPPTSPSTAARRRSSAPTSCPRTSTSSWSAPPRPTCSSLGRQHRPASARLPPRRLRRSLAACAGSIYSLALGAQFIQTGKYKRVLCIGAETLSRSPTSPIAAPASCWPTPPAPPCSRPPRTRGIIDVDLYSDGQYWELLYMPGGGSRHPGHRTRRSDARCTTPR